MSLKYFLSMSLGQLRGFIIELVVLGGVFSTVSSRGESADPSESDR